MGQLTDTGYQADRAIDIIAAIREDFESRTGLTPDWDRDVILGILTAMMGERLGALDEAVQALYQSFDPTTATGSMLTALSLLVGVGRNEATQSVATVTLGGTSGTVVPSGSLVQGGGPEGVSRWRTSTTVTIPDSVEVIAEDYGAVTAAIGEIDTIVSLVAGWSTVTNAAAAVTGREADTDAVLRLTRGGRIAARGAKSRQALRARLLDIDGVEAALVIENTTNATATVQGLSLPANSIAVAISPSGLADAVKQEILDTIWQYGAAAGIRLATSGADVTGTVIAEDTTEKTVAYYEATTQAITCAATIAVAPGFDETAVEAAVAAVFQAYFDEVGMGGLIVQAEIVSRIIAVPGVLWALPVTIVNSSTARVQLDALKVGSAGTPTITVSS